MPHIKALILEKWKPRRVRFTQTTGSEITGTYMEYCLKMEIPEDYILETQSSANKGTEYIHCI